MPGPKKANGTKIGYFNEFKYTQETFVDRNGAFCVVPAVAACQRAPVTVLHLDLVTLCSLPPLLCAVYVKTQPLETRKNGFGSRNAKMRDEFMSHIRTEQYREQLRSETKATVASASTSALVTAGEGITAVCGPAACAFCALVCSARVCLRVQSAASATGSPGRYPKRSGFDVMRDDRSPRSVYNIRGIKKGERDLGSVTLSSGEFGTGLDTVPLSKSEFARDSTCDQFYSNVHLDAH